MEGVVGFTFRGAALLALGALVGAAFPGETRVLARRGMVLALQATAWARTAGAEAMEKGLDVVAEARAEHEQMVRAAEQEADRRRLRVVREQNGNPPRRRRTTRGATRSTPPNS
jgi:hypothetical protein